MKKLLLVLGIVALLLSAVLSVPVQAFSVTGVYYNFNAAANQPALTVYWGSDNKPPTNIMGDQFALLGGEKTLADVEARIKQTIYDATVKVTPLSQFPIDDPVRADPPVLGPGEWISGNKLYNTETYFSIHIYSLSPLSFTTRFQYGQYGDIPDGWWQ